MTIPSTQPRKSASPPPSVCTGSRGAVARQCSRMRREECGCSSCCIFLVAIVLVGFGAAAILVYRHYSLSWNMHTYHDGDQVLVSSSSSDLNSVLCQKYTVTSGDRADIFLTDGPAQISSTMREVIQVSDSGLMADDSFDFRAFYLLPGSEVAVRACMHEVLRPSVQTEIIIIKGDHHFRQWLGDSSCSHCILHQVPMMPLGLCIIARYIVEKADNYYVIITRVNRGDAQEPVRAEVDMKVTKTIYDFSRLKQTCHMARSCQLNLTYGAHDDVIVQFPGKGTLPATSTFFTTECHLRRWFWVTVFGLLPAAIILLLLLCCVMSARSTSRRSATMRRKKQDAGRVFLVSEPEDKQPKSSLVSPQV